MADHSLGGWRINHCKNCVDCLCRLFVSFVCVDGLCWWELVNCRYGGDVSQRIMVSFLCRFALFRRRKAVKPTTAFLASKLELVHPFSTRRIQGRCVRALLE
eukprot:809822_1